MNKKKSLFVRRYLVCIYLWPMFWSCISVVKTIDWLWIWIFVPKNETGFIIRSLRGRDVTWQVGRSWHYWINNFRICKANDDRKKTSKSQEENHHFFFGRKTCWSIDYIMNVELLLVASTLVSCKKGGIIDKWHVTCDASWSYIFYQFHFLGFQR